MTDLPLLAACALFIVGTYAFRIAGVLIGSRRKERADESAATDDQPLDHAVAILLASVIATSLVSPSGIDPAKAAGVAMGAALVARGKSLMLVVLAAAATSGLLRVFL